MRLYLSSFRLGNTPEKFIEMIGANKRVAVIGNAVDYNVPEERAVKMKQEKDMLKAYNLDPEEIDLRQYFGKETELANIAGKFGAVWIRGGNVFVLRRAMQASSFDTIIKSLILEDKIVYAGYSAAVCVLAPTLKGFSIVDDPEIVPDSYLKEIIWEGLGVLDYSIEPHYKSDHPESVGVDKEIAYLEEHNMPYRTLRDGEALVINNGLEEVVGL